MNTSNSDNVIVNSKFPHINVQTKSSFNTLITFQSESDTESSIIINNWIIDKNNLSEEISYHQNSAKVIDHTCGENGKFYSIYKKKWMSNQFILSMQIMIYIGKMMIILSINIMHHFLSNNHENVFFGPEYDSAKRTVFVIKKYFVFIIK